jgi:hypothetical protein
LSFVLRPSSFVPGRLIDALYPPNRALEIANLDVQPIRHPGQPRARGLEAFDLIARLRVEPAQANGRQALIRDMVEQALRRWETRITVNTVTVDPDPSDPTAAIVQVTYQVVGDGATFTAAVPVALTGGE